MLQHCCDIVSNSYNIVPALQRWVAQKNRLCELSRVTSPLQPPVVIAHLRGSGLIIVDWKIEKDIFSARLISRLTFRRSLLEMPSTPEDRIMYNTQT